MTNRILNGGAVPEMHPCGCRVTKMQKGPDQVQLCTQHAVQRGLAGLEQTALAIDALGGARRMDADRLRDLERRVEELERRAPAE